MKVHILGGSSDGKALSFEGPLITIGRDESNTLHLPEPGVSGRHGFIEKIDGNWILRDTGSTNGITVNGTKLTDKAVLQNDDTLKIGVIELKIELISAPEKKVIKTAPVAAATSKKQISTSSKEKAEKKDNTQKKPSITPTKNKTVSIQTASFKIDNPEKIDELRQEKAEQRRKAKKMAKLKSRLVTLIVLILIGIGGKIGYDKLKPIAEQANTSPTTTEKPTAVTFKTPVAPAPKRVVKDSPLYIQSYPSGATVEINGTIMGTTPLELFEYKSGAHIITIYKDGYEATEFPFSHPDNPIQIHTLKQEPNTAFICSEPTGSAVTIGGQIRGHTPLLLRNLPEGYTNVTLTSQGYEPTAKEFEITPKFNRQYVHLKHSNKAGAMKIITRPPGVKIFMNGDFIDTTSSKEELALASDPLVLKGFIPGTYQMKITSLDGSEDKSLPVTLVGGEITDISEQLWMINSVLTLNDDTKVYGLLANKLENGDIEFSEKQGLTKIYKAQNISSIEPATMRDKYGFTDGIEISADRFQPILSTIHDENDDTDYEAIAEEAKSLETTSDDIEADINELDLFEMMTKYKNTNMTVTGKVSFIREGESMYSIVIDNRIECYLEKDDTPEQKAALVQISGKSVTVKGLCLGVRGLDRVVIVNSSYQ